MVKKIDKVVKELSPAEKKARLLETMAFNNKKYGREVLAFAKHKEVERIPFQCDEFNEITGGGVPVGRFSVIWGPKGGSKSSSCYGLVGNAQKTNKLCAWIDLEQSFDSSWAKVYGVEVDDLMLCNKFETAEELMDVIVQLTKEKLVDMIVIDSIQGLSPKGEQETKKGVKKSLEDDTMGLLARRLSKFFRVSAAGVAQADCTIVLIGQSRKDLGGFIALDKLSGGNALEHWSSMTLQIRRGQKGNAPARSKKTGNAVKGSNPDAELCGFETVMKVEKSKVGASEGKEARATFYFGEGYKTKEEVVEETSESNI